MDLTPKDLSILQFAIGDAIDHQGHILDMLTMSPRGNGFREAIKERRELLAKYEKLRTELKSVSAVTARCCEVCGKPATNRICSNTCYAEHDRRLEAMAALPILRDRHDGPPRSSPDR
jgi:hypothetical protein